MAVIDHGIFAPYTPENPEMFGGQAALYLRNEQGQDWYDLSKAIAPGAALVEVFANGVVFGWTGRDGEEIDYSTRWPVERRLLEVRPPRDDLAGKVWDGADFVAPPAPALTKIAKADLWRRLTELEAVTLDAALQAAPLRLRRIFEAAQYLDTADEDYPALRAGIVAALGETRADEVLAPTY